MGVVAIDPLRKSHLIVMLITLPLHDSRFAACTAAPCRARTSFPDHASDAERRKDDGHVGIKLRDLRRHVRIVVEI